MKLGFFEHEGWEDARFRGAFPDAEISVYPHAISEDLMPEKRDLEGIVIFTSSRITPKVLDMLPGLRYVATRSTGYDHIDVAECRKRGIAVSYVPGYGDNTVAEYAFGLLLSLTRKIYESADAIKETEAFNEARIRGEDLMGKTIGIIGTGRIGKMAIHMAKGFGMQVIAYDAKPDEAFAKEADLRYVGLEELLASADVISLHCPYMPATHHLLNRDNMKRIKKGAYLVNTARGGLIETDALVDALQDGTLAGAALDVIEEENETNDESHFLNSGKPTRAELEVILENHVLMKMPNVLITPHNAFNTKEAMERILAITIENITSYISGNPKNLVP
jgi:D-lactate dehydrogenase